MHVMILEEDAALRRTLAARLAPLGLDVLSFGQIAPAKDALRSAMLDVLVLGERVGGRLAHDVALLAEWRNPGLAAILLSEREGEGREELFDLLPCLHAVLARDTDARTLARLVLAAARSQEEEEESPRPPRPAAEEAGAPPPSRPAAMPVASHQPRPQPAATFLRASPPRRSPAASPAPAVTRPAALPTPARAAAPPRRLHLA